MCQKSPFWQRKNRMKKVYVYPTGSHCAFHYHNQTWKIWRDACYYFLHLTAFLRWKNRDKNEMKLHWPPLRESKTMATFYHIYNIFNAQIEGDWRVKYFRFSSPLNSFGALLGLRFFFTSTLCALPHIIEDRYVAIKALALFRNCIKS